MRTIDLNADLGEGFGPWTMGDDAAMLSLVTSANVACGGHASDPETMFRTLEMARDRRVVVGAHPSYPDMAGFGRRRLIAPPEEITRFVAAQVGSLVAIGALAGHRVRYVKPHGALANVAAVERDVADAIARSVQAIDPQLGILAIAGTQLELATRALGMTVYREIYADRGYTATGLLVPRDQPGAIIHDPAEATDRLLRFLETGAMLTVDGGQVPLQADSICVHGDNPSAVDMARSIRAALSEHGIAITSFVHDA